MVEKENKYKYWVVTLQFTKIMMRGVPHANLPQPKDVISAFKEVADKFVFQLEVTPTTGKDHYQCVISTKIRKRHSTLLNELADLLNVGDKSGIQLDRMRSEWETAVLYCTKDDTRKEGTYPYFSEGMIEPYKGADIQFLSERDNRYPWQNEILDILFTDVPYNLLPSDGRSVIWVTDEKGNSGKSLLVKYLCFNNKDIAKVSFGTAGQLRSSVISTGAKKLYFIDIPRTLGTDDSLNNILTVLEDIANGYIVSNYFGAYKSLMFDSTHIVVFSNMTCPYDKLSGDRWKVYHIINKNLHRITENGFLRRCGL